MSDAVLDKAAEYLGQADTATYAAILSLLPPATQVAITQRVARTSQSSKAVVPLQPKAAQDTRLSLTSTGVAISEAPAAPKLQRPDGLSLTVKDSHGNTIFFAVKKTTRMCKLIQAYAEKVGMHESKVRFIYDGDRVSPWATPEDLDMQDQDQIDAFQEMMG